MTYVKSDNYRIGTTPQCYAVLAKCGHDNVKSRACFMPILFGVVGWTGCADEAAAVIRDMDRVKHDDPEAILFVVPIGYDTYKKIRIINDFDPFMNVSSKREQLAFQDEVERRAVNEPFIEVSSRRDYVRFNEGFGKKAVFRTYGKESRYDDYEVPYIADAGEHFEDEDLILQRYAAGIRDGRCKYTKGLATAIVDEYVDYNMARLLESEHCADVQERLCNFEHYHKGIRTEKYRTQE